MWMYSCFMCNLKRNKEKNRTDGQNFFKRKRIVKRRRIKGSLSKSGTWTKFLACFINLLSIWKINAKIWTFSTVAIWTLARPDVPSSNWLVINKLTFIYYAHAERDPQDPATVLSLHSRRPASDAVHRRDPSAISPYQHSVDGLC